MEKRLTTSELEALEDFPFLIEKSFRQKYPHALAVVAIVSSEATRQTVVTGSYEPLKRAGFNSPGDFALALRQDHPKAVKFYEDRVKRYLLDR
jgi:hypothetical protein